VIRTQERVRTLAAGRQLEVVATDAGTLEDIPAWCRVHGHELMACDTVEGELGGGPVYRFRIQVSDS
jgi:tRNA 2-thiouridine synthesizing protein A